VFGVADGADVIDDRAVVDDALPSTRAVPVFVDFVTPEMGSAGRTNPANLVPPLAIHKEGWGHATAPTSVLVATAGTGLERSLSPVR